MFDLRLRFNRTGDGMLIFALPPRTRLGFAAVAAATAASAVVAVDASSAAELARALPRALGPVGNAVLLLAVAAALYEERWTFDPRTRSVSFRFGLVFAARSRSVPFDQVESVAVETFVKGTQPGTGDADGIEAEAEPEGLKRLFRKKKYASLVLYLKDAERLVVETVPSGDRALLERAAEDIRPLLIDR